MNRMLIAVLGVLMLTAAESRAAVFERDWKAPGDGLLTYDNVNLREWLDVTESDVSMFSPPRVDNAIAETGPGGLFEGFTLASVEDVTDLASSAGIEIGTQNFALNGTATRSLINLLGVSWDVPADEAEFSVGWLSEFTIHPQPNCPCRLSAIFGVYPLNGLVGTAGLDLGIFTETSHPGLMLWRAAVPEPSVLTLAICSLICLSFFRNKQIAPSLFRN